MINNKIISQASKTNFYGLKKKYTHKYKMKNKNCGDIINLEVIIKNQKFKSMRYETESCIYCQASASFLAYSIKQFSISDFKRIFLLMRETAYNKSTPKKYKKFEFLFSNKNRIDCVLLPFNALLKACKIL
jgi:NifU-like protein involved in Fe-S cluster formation